MGFWVKPFFNVEHSNRIRKLFNATPTRRKWTKDDLFFSFETWTGGDYYDTGSDFSLYYFARGGRRVATDGTGRLADSKYIRYHPEEDEWLPTRSLFINAGKYSSQGWYYEDPIVLGEYSGMGTPSVNQDWRIATDVKSPGTWNFNLESNQWSQITFSWDWAGIIGEPSRYYHLSINGKFIEHFPPYSI